MPAEFDPAEGGAQFFDAYPSRPANRLAAAVWVMVNVVTLLGVLFGLLL